MATRISFLALQQTLSTPPQPQQVGNGEARNCGDPAHNHSIHGGSFWAEAFDGIMTEVRASVKPASTMYMTEGIVEEVSGAGFDILLGLEFTAAQPVWHAVYGGYGYATGRAGAVRDPLGKGFVAQLTQQFMSGGTMGWFTYQNYGNQFFDPANAQRVAYIRALSRARIAGKPWMVHGRATRTIRFGDPVASSLMAGCFLREAKGGVAASVVCAIALPSSPAAAAPYALDLVPARYGLDVPSGSHVVVSDLMTGAVLGTYTDSVTYGSTVAPLTIQLLHLAVVLQ